MSMPPLARTATPPVGIADRVWRQVEALAGITIPGLVGQAAG